VDKSTTEQGLTPKMNTGTKQNRGGRNCCGKRNLNLMTATAGTKKLRCAGIKETPVRDKSCGAKKNEEGPNLAARLPCEHETQSGEEPDPRACPEKSLRTEQADGQARLGAHAARTGNRKSLACSGKEILNGRMDSTT
jgi:hypothetical protein